MYIPKVSDKVHVNTYFHNGTGIVEYVDNKNLYNDHFYPIQVYLDKPYDDSGQRTIRVNLKEIVGKY